MGFRSYPRIGESICKTGASAPGPVAAMTSMLYDAGCAMEILSFHQHEIGHRTATFLLCESAGIRLWAMGIGESGTESTLRAMISGATGSDPPDAQRRAAPVCDRAARRELFC